MQFELSEALIDQILFSMEDQRVERVVDASTGLLVDRSEAEDDEDRYLPLPAWHPADGFRLMECFAAGLRSPVVRGELVDALDRGRGVFRAFKDALGRAPEVEKLWFAFKNKEMRADILEWYNALREEWGLERLGEEPEETEDLVLEDFRFEDEAPDAESVEAFLAQALPADAAGLRGAPGAFSAAAYTARDELAGLAAARTAAGTFRVELLAVDPAYRGLGLGEALLDRLLSRFAVSGADRLELDLPEASSAFRRVLFRRGFAVSLTRYVLEAQKFAEADLK